MIPRKFWKFLVCRWCDLIYFGSKNKTKKKLFMIIKFDLEVALFHLLNSIFFLKPLSLEVFNLLLYECTILQPVELCRSTEDPMTDTSWHTSNLTMPSAWKLQSYFSSAKQPSTKSVWACYIWRFPHLGFQLWLVMWCLCYTQSMGSAVDQIKEPGSKSWTSDPPCLNLDW